jgi:hypothetical protein
VSGITGGREVEVGVVVAPTPDGGKELETFTAQLLRDSEQRLEEASGRAWRFQKGEKIKLESDGKTSGADFVGEASLRLAQGSYDLMIVITDAPLMSANDRIVSGVASPLTRICVLSTRQLQRPGRGPDLPLDAPSVRWNAATLLLNLIGRILGARPDAKEGAMAHFVMDPKRGRAEPYVPPKEIRALADRFVEEEYHVGGALSRLWAHIRSIAYDPAMLLRALVRNRALLLPLRLPGLAAAAVAPVFILVFTAEMWDAGLGMTNTTAIVYALISVAGATLYLTFAQNLFLPRKEGPVLPRHLALANVVIFTTILLGVIGLFVMLMFISMALEVWVMPQGLISTWPTLHEPQVTIWDKLRLASFVATVGVTTGALAGGLQARNVLRQMALFETAA